jgi:hypothetical protein
MSGGEIERKIIFEELNKFFGLNNEVSTRKRTATGSQDNYDSFDMYNPELDIWIGPINTRKFISEDNKKINKALINHDSFLQDLNSLADKKYNPDCLNNNPRFFLAIEVGGSGSEKHLLGEMFNVSILGKIGIIISTNDNTHKSYLRHCNYINYAQNVGKIPMFLGNVMVIRSDAILRYLKGKNIN